MLKMEFLSRLIVVLKWEVCRIFANSCLWILYAHIVFLYYGILEKYKHLISLSYGNVMGGFHKSL